MALYPDSRPPTLDPEPSVGVERGLEEGRTRGQRTGVPSMATSLESSSHKTRSETNPLLGLESEEEGGGRTGL